MARRKRPSKMGKRTSRLTKYLTHILVPTQVRARKTLLRIRGGGGIGGTTQLNSINWGLERPRRVCV